MGSSRRVRGLSTKQQPARPGCRPTEPWEGQAALRRQVLHGDLGLQGSRHSDTGRDQSQVRARGDSSLILWPGRRHTSHRHNPREGRAADPQQTPGQERRPHGAGPAGAAMGRRAPSPTRYAAPAATRTQTAHLKMGRGPETRDGPAQAVISVRRHWSPGRRKLKPQRVPPAHGEREKHEEVMPNAVTGTEGHRGWGAASTGPRARQPVSWSSADEQQELPAWGRGGGGTCPAGLEACCAGGGGPQCPCLMERAGWGQTQGSKRSTVKTAHSRKIN